MKIRFDMRNKQDNMRTHVFIVNDDTFLGYLNYLFAESVAKGKGEDIGLLSDNDSSGTYSLSACGSRSDRRVNKCL
jgi:hypothetical protein